MQYLATERDISQTVRDFETMCAYIHDNKLQLTQKGNLSTKACFELNERMTHPKQGARKTDRIGSYATVSLYFQLASASGMLEPCKAKGEKTTVALSEAYDSFQQLNSFSKYLFIFLSWMRNTNIEEAYGRYPFFAFHDSSVIDDVITEMGKQSEFNWVLREENYDVLFTREISLQALLYGPFDFLCHFRDFGLVQFDDQDVGTRDARSTTVEKIRITPFGAALSAACSSRKFSWVNRWENETAHFEDGDDCISAETERLIEDYKKNPPGSDGFLAPFLSCFPEGAVHSVNLNSLLFPQSTGLSDSTVYELNVQLESDCCRVIQCAGNHTFEDLHLAIQEAFGFDNDHLYSFFMDGKRWSRRRINSPYCDEPPYSNEMKVGEIGLRVKQSILYLFDFGDEWEFRVTVTSIAEADFPPRRPVIVHSHGKAPEQYL